MTPTEAARRLSRIALQFDAGYATRREVDDAIAAWRLAWHELALERARRAPSRMPSGPDGSPT